MVVPRDGKCPLRQKLVDDNSLPQLVAFLMLLVCACQIVPQIVTQSTRYLPQVVADDGRYAKVDNQYFFITFFYTFHTLSLSLPRPSHRVAEDASDSAVAGRPPYRRRQDGGSPYGRDKRGR